MANNEQVNVPSLLVILALSGLIVRYLFFSTPASSRAQQAAARESSTARSREAAVAQLQQMFPQVDRRTLLWDLQRTGGNMAATTDRVLAGRMETVGSPFTLDGITSVTDWLIGDVYYMRVAPANVPAATSPGPGRACTVATSERTRGARRTRASGFDHAVPAAGKALVWDS